MFLYSMSPGAKECVAVNKGSLRVKLMQLYMHNAFINSQFVLFESTRVPALVYHQQLDTSEDSTA